MPYWKNRQIQYTLINFLKCIISSLICIYNEVSRNRLDVFHANIGFVPF